MKFLFLSSFAHLALDPAATRVAGGAELQVALLARELAARGHGAVIVGADHGQPRERVFENVRCVTAGRFHTGGLSDTLAAMPAVFGAIARERPDFIVVRGWTTWLFFLLAARRRTGPRLIFQCSLDTELNGEFRRANPFRGALFEIGVRRADGRFAMSETQRRLYKNRGLDCALYRNLVLPRTTPPPPKDLDLLWIARGQAIKRPHHFLDLAEALPSARCAMICPREDAALFQSVEARATRLANVEFHEHVPYREAQTLFDRAEIFVNTSAWEGFANAFIQAGQGGAAILSLSVNSDDVLTRFDAGVCAGDDPARLLAAARELLDDPARRRALQAGAARFVAEWHDNARNVDAFLAGLPS